MEVFSYTLASLGQRQKTNGDFNNCRFVKHIGQCMMRDIRLAIANRVGA